MKNLVAIILLLIFGSYYLMSQEYVLPENLDYKKHFQWDKSKWLRKADKTAIKCKSALHFKLVSKATEIAGKGMDSRASATSYAILNGISEKTMQEIADEYYVILNKKLTEAGFKMLPYENVKKSDVYEKMMNKEKDRTYSEKSRGAAFTVTAYNGPNSKYHEANIGTWGLFKKIAKKNKALVINSDVIIEFANFDIDLKKSRGFRYEAATASTTVLPDVIVTPYTSVDAGGTSMLDQTQSTLTFLDAKGMSYEVKANKSISFGGDYATKIESFSGQMPAVMKRFVNIKGDLDLSTGTFEITADEEQFKKDVLAALERYADILVKKLIMTLEK